MLTIFAATAVILRYHDQPKLISNGPFSIDYTAGLVIGLFTLFRQEAGLNPYYTIEVKSATTSLYFNLLDANQFLVQISPYLIIEGVLPNNIINNSTRIPPHQYGWWIHTSYNSGTYNLYGFTTEDFISGFIAAFANTTHDFRNYIAGPPFSFDSISKQINPIIVTGYEIKLFNPRPRIPDLLVPYETGSYEIGVPHGIDYD